MKLTAQIKLLPSPEQATALLETIERANAAANHISQLAWESKQFRQFDIHRLCYSKIKAESVLSAQVIVRLIAKVAGAYKIPIQTKRTFRRHGSIAYDTRILKWKTDSVSIWTVAGRSEMPFVCGPVQRKLLASQRGETDLVYRDGKWFLFATTETPGNQERPVTDWLGCDLGLVNILADSDGNRYSGEKLTNLRVRNQRLRKRLQRKGSRGAKRLLRSRRIRERRMATHVNHTISKRIVSLAERTDRGISLENLNGIRNRIRARKRERTRLHSWAFQQLGSFVSYKAKRAGVPIRFVDPRNTSITCSQCGCIDKRSRKTRDVFQCVECGYEIDADVNAAKSIRRAAVNLPHCLGSVDLVAGHVANCLLGNGVGPLQSRLL